MDWDKITTKEGIASCLDSMEDFDALVSARHEAGYKDGKRLPEFIVLGTWMLDTCGNAMRASDFVPKDKISIKEDV